MRKNINYNINIDFSNELDIKLKSNIFNDRKIKNKKKKKKRYLSESKLICNIYNLLFKNNNYGNNDYINFVNNLIFDY